jgi:hypothetical protein
MGNHYHLLLETPEANLVEGMKWLQGTYTQRFNSRHKVWGHLLQGRYKALLVDGRGGDYFSTVGNYIHLNPARAKCFDLESGKLSDYRWSSFPLYGRPSKRPVWLDVDRMMGAMGLEDSPVGRRRYREYLNKRVMEIAGSNDPKELDEHWARIRRGWFFGSDEFKEVLLSKIEKLSGKRESFSGDEVKRHDEYEAEKLLEEGLGVLGLSEPALSAMRKGADKKALLAWLVRRNTMVSNAWIAERLDMGRADCLSRYPKRIDDTEDKRLIVLREKLREITILRD